jgi:proline-specific peptidase
MATSESGYVKVKGFNLYYEMYGNDKSEVTLLTLHGGPGFTHHQLLPLTGITEKATPIRVIFYDQLGCGKSDRSSDLGNYRISSAVDEVEGLRGALGLGKVCLLGHSYGGNLALEYALKYQSNLEKLILSSSCASIPETIKAFDKLKSSMPEEVRRILEKYEALEDYENPEYKKAVEELYRRHVFRGTAYPPDLEASLGGFNPDVYWTMWGKHEFICTGNMREWDITGRLGEISVPTLVLVGRYDELPVELSEEMRKRIPKSVMVILENSSHFGMFEESEKYLDAVYAFITGK